MIPLLGAALLAGGCQLSAAALTGWAGTEEEPAAAAPIPAEYHLDAGIARFTGELTEEEKKAGENFARVRVAETLYLPQQLRQAMLRGGGWRNVWVIPARALTDVRVEGEILASDGSEMKLAVRAVDATGDVWLKRTYEHEFSAEDYAEKAAGRPTDALFDRIAADLLAARDRRGEAGLREIRSVAELRFAREFVPGAFARHLSEADGRARLVGLPARGDTTYQLTLQLKERDDRFLETAQGYAQDFAARIDDPYRDWARQSHFERAARDELVTQSWVKGLLGALAIAGGVAIAADGGNAETRQLGQVLVAGGAYGVYDAYQDYESTEIHDAALQELGQSLSLEVEPQVVEVENRTRTLTGSLEQQYEQWHDVLGEIYRADRAGLN